jgi:ABC-type lipoprotein release transport system permease subunit
VVVARGGVAALACERPARRILKTDPMKALRSR